MDAAIMQKLLPKLHGSKKNLGPVLECLALLCLKEENRPREKASGKQENVFVEKNARFWNSLQKVKRMRKRLAECGFTSFAEA